jgi:hypothetical protein
MREGKALPMKFWIIYEHPKRMMEQLQRVMPGVKWPQYKNRVLPTLEQRAEIAERIAAYLKALPPTVSSISCQSLRADVQLMQSKRTTFTRAVDAALKSVPWERKGKSVVRKESIAT